jgi:hypothetical protein
VTNSYYIKASGCDDSTAVIVDLTDVEAAVVAKVAQVITTASESGCQPTLRVRLATDEDRAALEEDGAE